MNEKCVYDESWAGRCTNPCLPGEDRCRRHVGLKCWCGAPASHECGYASQFVCGAPLCDWHSCRYEGRWGPHDKVGRDQYLAWKAAQ